MKICWDILERVLYDAQKERFYQITGRGERDYLFLHDSCRNCGEEFLSTHPGGEFCDRYCRNSGAFNPMHGRRHTEEMKARLSAQRRGRVMHQVPKGHLTGSSNPSWKGGITKQGLATWDTYGPVLNQFDEVRENPQLVNALEAKCNYCGRWFMPTRRAVRARIEALNGKGGSLGTENRFYCSDDCKKLCPIFRQRWSTKDNNGLSREVQPQLRQLVFARDNYTCQRCGVTESLQCHHFEGIAVNPIESADIDNCITLCQCCHAAAHRDLGCRYSDLSCYN